MSVNEAKDIAKEMAAHPQKPLMGQFPDTDRAIGHPIHPATVHWPIAFLSTSLTIWSLPLLPVASFQGIAGKASTVSAGYASTISGTAGAAAGSTTAAAATGLARLLPPVGALPGIAHYSALLGLALAMPSIATGVAEGYAMLKGQADQKGSWTQVAKDGWALKGESGKKAWLTFEHASMNDIVAGIVAWNAWKSFKSPDFAITRGGSILSAIGLGMLLYSASLGGKLIYEHGVGVQRQGVGKEYKKE